LVHDGAPFLLLPFTIPKLRSALCRGRSGISQQEGWPSALTPTTPVVRCDDTQSDAMLLAMRNARRGSYASVRRHRRAFERGPTRYHVSSVDCGKRGDVRSVKRPAPGAGTPPVSADVQLPIRKRAPARIIAELHCPVSPICPGFRQNHIDVITYVQVIHSDYVPSCH
jgi:hypothetical protein